MAVATQTDSLQKTQLAANYLAKAERRERPRALEELAQAILDCRGHSFNSNPLNELLSVELPSETQRFAAVWLIWTIAKSPEALDFKQTEALAGKLFDRVFINQVYGASSIDSKMQTFEKLPKLAEHLQSILDELDGEISNPLDLDNPTALKDLQTGILKVFNDKRRSRPFLFSLLPRQLINESRIKSLISEVAEFSSAVGADPLESRNRAIAVCDEFEKEAKDFGTEDAQRILGGLARKLKSAVDRHFETIEKSKVPELRVIPIDKKYPLHRPGAQVNYMIRIENFGTGPARELRMDEVLADDCLAATTPREVKTVYPGESHVFNIQSKVLTASSEAGIYLQYSWSRLSGRDTDEAEFLVLAQRENVNWESVEFTEPYPLEPITAGEELIGRKDELKRLLRLTNQKAVGSGIIFGQKRVGKTSLANAVAERLESDQDKKWVVVSRGSGDYRGNDANSTIMNLGEELSKSIRRRIPGLDHVPIPSFDSGLAPLSTFVEEALTDTNLRLLFILDEFDELPLELIDRNDLSTSLFLTLRQISNKPGCGFLLVGGENMQRILNNQGDRLNKFRQIEVDYFDRARDWSDFVDLIRKPVENWLTISDTALEKLFDSSAGNPYFAKMLAAQLFSNMVENRDSDVGEFDADKAIQDVLKTIGSNSFTHFWADGLVKATEDTNQHISIRRSVLIAVGRALRTESNPDADVIWDEFRNRAGLPFEEQSFRQTLQDFVRRRVLDETGKSYTPKIPLFGAWLGDRGVGALLEDSQELDALRVKLQEEEALRVTDQEVSGLASRLDGFLYRGRTIDSTAIRSWLGQFDTPQEERLMFRLLSGVRFYSQSSIRAKMKEAYSIVTRNVHTVIERGTRVRRDIIVSSLDESPAKSGLSYCRLFTSENQISAELVLTIDSIDERFLAGRKIQRLVLVDDFSATGQTIVEGLEKHMALLKRLNSDGIRIVVVTIVGLAQARERLEKFINKNSLVADVYFCDELGNEDRAFSEESNVFLMVLSERLRGTLRKQEESLSRNDNH